MAHARAATYGMRRTTISLPEDLKAALERTAAAQGLSEAGVVRSALLAATSEQAHPSRVPLFDSGHSTFAEHVDDELAGRAVEFENFAKCVTAELGYIQSTAAVGSRRLPVDEVAPKLERLPFPSAKWRWPTHLARPASRLPTGVRRRAPSELGGDLSEGRFGTQDVLKASLPAVETSRNTSEDPARTVQMGCTGDSRRGFVRLPIDTSQLTFLCAAPARPVTDFETKQHKADLTTGELLYNVQVVALDSEGAEVIQLKVAGDPKVGQGAMLKLEGLVALPWSMGERSGVSFRASKVETNGVAPGAGPQRQPEKAAA